MPLPEELVSLCRAGRYAYGGLRVRAHVSDALQRSQFHTPDLYDARLHLAACVCHELTW